MTNSSLVQFAEQLSDVMMRQQDLKVEVDAIVDAAKEAGIDTKALRKLAREMITEPDKLARKYADEEQLALFREEIDIHRRKGLVSFQEAAE